MIRNRIKELIQIRASELIPNPKNWRTHPAKQRAALNGLLSEIGIADAVLVRKTSKGYQLIDGHLRKDVLGETMVPALLLDLDEYESDKMLATLDPLAAMAGRNNDLIAELLKSVETSDAGLQKMLEEMGKSIVPVVDEKPERPKKNPGVKLGDVFKLGDHTLMCGDCSFDKNASAVLHGKKAAATLTDPPYAIGLDYSKHEDTSENLSKLISAFLPVALARSSVVLLTPGVTNQWLYPMPQWVLCWFYGGGQLRSSWGFNCWQPILAYGKDPFLAIGKGAYPDAVDMNTPANAADLDHPCPKPIAVWEWLMKRCSPKKGDLIFEPFSGSGTTILVAEQLERRVGAIEIDPGYCRVAIDRWEKFTGKKAKLVG